jgi:hypothetical protein
LEARGSSFTRIQLEQAIWVLQNPRQVSSQEYENMSVADFIKKVTDWRTVVSSTKGQATLSRQLLKCTKGSKRLFITLVGIQQI